MRLLVFGSNGQVGHELMQARVPTGWRVIGLARADADITDEAAVTRALARHRPDCVVNAAAYTAVDRAESDGERAFAVNAQAPAILARACNALGASLIHYSTDYVFDGTKPSPYIEEDPVKPLGIYGASKEAGESAVRAALPRHVILRTSWVYGAHGANFVKTMIRLAGERPELRVVADQIGCPTAAADIAEASIALAERIAGGDPVWGTFHYAGVGATSWHGFAIAIIDQAAKRTGRRPAIYPIASAEYPTPAKRPANSVLDCTALASAWGIRGKPWLESLAPVIDSVFSNATENRRVS